MKFHDLANIFPLMTGDDFAALCNDIKANGLLEPIWLHDGQIIDGRNRYRACVETSTELRYRTWNGSGSLVSFVMSLNLNRRHLTASQRAAIALDVLPMLEKENPQGNRKDLSTGGKNATSKKTKNRDTAAKMLGVGARYISDIKQINKDAPDLIEQVRKGEINIPEAKREIVKRSKKAPPPLPDDKYRVVYADPPWQYGNSGVIGGTDNYGHVHRHYPSLSILELCAMKVKEICAKNAVLFMWVTSPLLEECFPVIKAWGFKYKTSFVWDKIGHNFGHYNSVRHEFLLICTRGQCTPDISKKIDSVQSIQKTRKHSEKPPEFRDIIDTLYPTGKRIELFSRQNVPNWDAWGNE